MKWTPKPQSNKFDQPVEEMPAWEKGLWAGIIIGGLAANIIWVIILKSLL